MLLETKLPPPAVGPFEIQMRGGMTKSSQLRFTPLA